MPIKQHLTKSDMLAYKIRKIASKGAIFRDGKIKSAETVYNPEEKDTITKAIIVASFASGHSWQTNKCIARMDVGKISSTEIRRESDDAASSKWKNVSNLDISEVSKINIPESVFSAWVYFNVDRSMHEYYKRVWTDFKDDFKDDCEYFEGRESKQARPSLQK